AAGADPATHASVACTRFAPLETSHIERAGGDLRWLPSVRNGRPRLRRATRCSTSPTGRPDSPRRRSACAKGVGRNWRWLPPRAAASSGRCSSGGCRPVLTGRRSSSGRSPPGPPGCAPARRKRGIGSTLVHHALREAARRRYGAVLLVGDAPYYSRFGFSSEKTSALWLPGPYERHRLLGCELKPGALDGARGLIGARSPLEQRPELATLVAGLVGSDNSLAPHAA